MSLIDDHAADAVQRYWRRQVVLTLLAGGLALVAFALLAAAAAWSQLPVTAWRVGGDGAVRVGRPAAELFRFVFWPAMAAVLAAVVLLAFALAHSFRVASLTFRRGH